MPFVATWVNLKIIILSELSQTDKDEWHVTPLICGTLRNDTNELIYETETDSHRKKTYGYRRGKGVKK